MSAERILKVEFHWNIIGSLKSEQQNMKFIHEESYCQIDFMLNDIPSPLSIVCSPFVCISLFP